MRRILTCICFALVILAGCSVMTVDALLELKVDGIVNTQQGEPIQNAKVRFYDTGIDQWRQSSGHSLVVGLTDKRGRLSSKFSYLFGYEIRGKSSPDLPGTFDLTVEADGFTTARLPYQISLLPEEDGVLILNFEVQLQEIPSE